ncbi:MAG: Nramp family divalent metal transporter [Acidobacteria bacterium]|nr:Nramp family divalent metal transporter [Acidobacteriota bacterium]
MSTPTVGAGSGSIPRHGLLPPWGVTDLPAPPPFTVRNVFRTIGPGVIGLGIAIGSGEWLLGPAIVARYGPTVLWVTTVSVLLQVFLNIEMARYTMYTGEPIITGYMRTWPGPGFWSWVYGVLTFLQIGWPGWALASATASAAILLARVPGAADAGLVKLVGYVTFGICVLILTVGRKIERNLEFAMWILMTAVFGYLLMIDLTMVSAESWSAILKGFVSFGALPSGGDWLLLGGFAAYSGLGGMSNAFITNWMRDKGFGMGATVGYIPSATGAHVPLSAHGNVFAVDARSRERWNSWFRYLNVDQWLIFAIGSVAGMMLTTLMSLEFIPHGTQVSGWAVADLQASNIAVRHGAIFWYLTLMTGFWVLFKTQLGNSDGLVRSVTDMLWSGSIAARGWCRGDVRKIYYTVMTVFIVWGCIALNLAQPLTLVVIGANVAGLNFVFVSLHTIVVNRKFLPVELRPPIWREILVAFGAVFFGGFVLVLIASRL